MIKKRRNINIFSTNHLGRGWTTLLKLFLLPVVLLLAPVSCEQPFSLVESLDGPDGIALTLSPESSQVVIMESSTLTASGGVPPYTFSISSGTGSIDASTGIYTAPALTGTDIVQVTDSYGATRTASVGIISGGPAALSINPTSITVYIGGGLTFAGNGGTPGYTYSIFTSSSGSPTINAATGAYIAGSTAGTDTVRVTDNIGTTVDASVSVTYKVTNVDYSVSAITDTSPTTVGNDPITGSFTITNIGSADGTKTIDWDVFVSLGDGVYSADDVLIDTGSTLQLTSTGSIVINFTGTWPTAAGTYFFIVKTSAVDDVTTANNTGSSAVGIAVTAPPLPNIDYIVTPGSITNVFSPAVGGSAISESFTITNNGTDNGSTTVYWTAYISTDAVFDNPGDTPIDSGQTTALGAGAVSAATNIDNGTWPTVSSTTPYYLFVDVSSSDELPANIDAGNQDSSLFSITVPDIDYEVISVSNGTPSANVTDGIAETFTFRNTGANNGSSDVLWTAYRSTDQTLDALDSIIDTGQESALAAGASASPAISGTWDSSGTYYILVKVSASDETGELNSYNSSGLFTIAAPGEIDYIVTNVSSNFLTVTTGSPVSETFDITNAGGLAGAAAVDWEVFVCDNAAFDGSEVSIGTGSTGFLAAGASTTNVPISATWTGTAGNYYLILELTAADETITSNNTNSSGPFTVYYPPDYSVAFDPSIVNLGQTGLAISGSPTFTITNDEPLNDGMNPITWQIYYSLDKVLSGDDVEMASGVESALAGNGSIQPSFSGTWPAAGNFYFLILTIGADDDENLNNNQTISIPIAVGDQIFEEVELNDNSTGTWDTGSTKINPAPLDECLTGTTLALSGTMDGFNGFDVFGFPMDKLVNSLGILVRWETGYDDIDFHLYFDTGAEAYNAPDGSMDTSIDSEPASVLALDVSSLNTDEILYLGINFWLVNNTSGSTGKPYTVLLTFN